MELLKPPDEIFIKEVIKARNFSDDRLTQEIRTLRDWLLKQPHLPNEYDERVLRKFIFGCKSLERAKEKLECLFEGRAKYPIIFCNRDPAQPFFYNSHPLGKHFFLPELTPDGSRVFFMGQFPGKEKLDHKGDMKSTAMLGDVYLLLENPATTSIIVIYDASNNSWENFKATDPVLNIQAVNYMQNVYPVSVKAIIVFNTHPTIELLMKVLKPFVKKKFQERMFFYSGDHTYLEKHIPLNILPSDYGGNAPSCRELQETWKNQVRSQREWLISEGEKIADLQKKPGGIPSDDDIMGVQGSFKTLEID